MSTLNKKMTGVRFQYTNQELNTNVAKAVELMNEVCEENDLIIKQGGETIDTIEMPTLDFSDLSKNRRKKIAKRISFFLHNKSRRSMNILLHFLRTRVQDMDKVYVEKSKKEQKIDSLRKEYKDLFAKTEAARVAFKAEKLGFYK